jgi:site-specific DNA-methyltransferase (cytosine-N4-specific)
MWLHMEDHYDSRGCLMRAPETVVDGLIHSYHWLLRGERIWHIPFAEGNDKKVPASINTVITDHCKLFHFTTQRTGYYFNTTELGGVPCSVFTDHEVEPRPGEFRTSFSRNLIAQSLLMTCPPGGTVLDPFCGFGTTGIVALDMGFNFIGIEIDSEKVNKLNDIFTRQQYGQ